MVLCALARCRSTPRDAHWADVPVPRWNTTGRALASSHAVPPGARRQLRPYCEAKPIDADRAFVANLQHFMCDVAGWRERLATTDDSERARLQAEANRAPRCPSRGSWPSPC